MKTEFIPYEQALELKELGFDERTLRAYYKESEQLLDIGSGNMYDTKAPLYQQAFRWFREKYNLYSTINVDMTMEPKFCYSIYEYDLEKYSEGWWIAVVNSDLYYTHEETELACLIKLIEIVKNK
jgi:hypothetical protein